MKIDALTRSTFKKKSNAKPISIEGKTTASLCDQSGSKDHVLKLPWNSEYENNLTNPAIAIIHATTQPEMIDIRNHMAWPAISMPRNQLQTQHDW